MGRALVWPELTAPQKHRLDKIIAKYPLAKVVGYDHNAEQMEPLVTLNGEYAAASYLDRSGHLV